MRRFSHFCRFFLRRGHSRPVYLVRRGRRVAAVIDADHLDEILELAGAGTVIGSRPFGPDPAG